MAAEVGRSRLDDMDPLRAVRLGVRLALLGLEDGPREEGVAVARDILSDVLGLVERAIAKGEGRD